ncbi:hypothetical protein POM88_019503 [Heracleum sosnowskyi]|uniref:Uncharacterized protein n=1 Tax=Heracleum sosnowskyi TaxID=360622 RepID=A0AAD8MRZ3_9APIA|nr:hypothetical protein POM88_019503 [Heracleum sosnowskyi]
MSILMPQNLKDYITELNLEAPPLFVAQKLLQVADVTSKLNRLLLPKRLINVEFFDNFQTEVDKELLEKKEAIEVNLVDGMMREYHTLHLAKWDIMKSCPFSVLLQRFLKFFNISLNVDFMTLYCFLYSHWNVLSCYQLHFSLVSVCNRLSEQSNSISKVFMMGSILKFRYMTLDLTLNSNADDKLEDHTIVADDINDSNLDGEECFVDECASDKESKKSRQSGVGKVPKKSRTPRVFLGQLTWKPREDAYLFSSAQVIIDEKNSRVSEKRPLDDQDYNVPDGVLVEKLTCEAGEDSYQDRNCQMIIHENNSIESEKRPLDEDNVVHDGVFIEKLTCELGEDSHQYHSAQGIIEKKNSRQSKKRPLDEEFIVLDDDLGKKRQKNGDEKTVANRRKQVPLVQNHTPSELPPNLQDYISKLNLEAPPMFFAQKVLTASDVRQNQNRLLMAKSIINTAFLENFVTDNEKKRIMNREDVEVSLVDNKMHEYHTLNFRQWEMTKSLTYSLKTAWFTVVTDNNLEEAVLEKDKDDNKKKCKEVAVAVMKEGDKLMSDVLVQPGEDVYQFRSAQVIIDEKNSKAPEKHPLDEDHVAPDDDYEEAESSDKKRQKRIEKKKTVPRKQVQVYNLPSELPQHFQEYISGLNLEVPPLFVAQKLLTVTDISVNQDRLSLPKSLINPEFRHNFLTENEKKLVKNTMHVEVNLVDDMMHEYNTLHMTQWAVNSTSPIVLRRAWNDVVLDNKLKAVIVLNEPKPIMAMEYDNKLIADVVARVWSFRRESNIWFALNLQAMTELKILGTTKKGVPILSK